MATLSEIRSQYPQYGDLSDGQLLDGLHRKFYADMPRDEFERRVGAAPQKPATVADGVSDAGEQAVRGVNRGLNSILSLPGAIVGGAVNLVAPGQGDRFKWDNPVSRMMESADAKPQTEAGRYADSIGQAIGSSVLPQAGLMAKARQVAAPAQTAIGGIGQQLVNAYRTSPGAAVGADAAASVGAGIGQQMAQEGGFGATGQMVGGLAGAVTPAGLAAAGGNTVRSVQRAYANQGRAGAYGSIADDLPNGVNAFADQVAEGPSRNSTVVNRRTLDILGEEMERAGGNVQQAQTAAINRIAQEFQVTPSTARTNIRNLTQVHEGSRLMMGEYPAVSASDTTQRSRQAGNIDLDALGRTEASTTQATMDYLANNGNAQSAQNVRNAVGRRQEDLAPAMRETLDAIAPRVAGTNRPASIVDTEQMVEQARQAGSAAYQAAYRGPINNWELVNRLPRVLDAARNYAAGRAGDVRSALNTAVDQFMIPTPNGPLAMGTLQQLQDARSVLRDQIQKLRNSGQNAAAMAVSQLRDRVTQMMTRASPAWRQANDQWADMNFMQLGQELGDAFSTQAGPRYREQLREFQRLAPEAQNIVRVHFLQKLADKLDNLPDSNSVSKLFSNDQSRAMIGRLFGSDAAVSFTRAVRDQKVAEASGRMMANAATHRRGVAQKQKDAETGLVSALENANFSAARSWILERYKQLMSERKNRPMADILTTPMTDTARVAQHLYNLRQQQQRLQQFAQPKNRPLSALGSLAPLINPLQEDGTR